VQQCLEGDSAAYRKLYDRYAKAMYNTAYRIVNKTTDAEDVLQEAFTDAFMQLKTFQQKSTFGAWLKQIVVYKSIYKVKQNRFFIDDISTLEDTKEDETNNTNEPELTIQKVKTAIQQLPDGYRTVLSLYLLEGYDHEEIAEILQVAHVTVRTQYIRAKNKLVEILKAVNVYE
jgi:RNA polymerase sigma factor (sigma-70 family)